MLCSPLQSQWLPSRKTGCPAWLQRGRPSLYPPQISRGEFDKKKKEKKVGGRKRAEHPTWDCSRVRIPLQGAASPVGCTNKKHGLGSGCTAPAGFPPHLRRLRAEAGVQSGRRCGGRAAGWPGWQAMPVAPTRPPGAAEPRLQEPATWPRATSATGLVGAALMAGKPELEPGSPGSVLCRGEEAGMPLCPVSSAASPALFRLPSWMSPPGQPDPGATAVPAGAKRVLNHGTAHLLCISFCFKERPRSAQQTVSLARSWTRLARHTEAFPTASPKRDNIPTPASPGSEGLKLSGATSPVPFLLGAGMDAQSYLRSPSLRTTKRTPVLCPQIRNHTRNDNLVSWGNNQRPRLTEGSGLELCQSPLRDVSVLCPPFLCSTARQGCTSITPSSHSGSQVLLLEVAHPGELGGP